MLVDPSDDIARNPHIQNLTVGLSMEQVETISKGAKLVEFVGEDRGVYGW
jgi:hypothetical protein